ncbi:hypothetical protein L6164_004937 [Bauhinia variegata]|uniref:Uncharacterized protein n=1 Tax=Bauhinia variegata TaxID=167791 RepID=A0ACB9PP23_BAUVA|nr:hypothetical protein L6164_004937 [Bauhinia variegata]
MKCMVGRREPSGNPSIGHVTDAQASGKKDARFRRTSSFNDGAMSETSFIDMLRKPVLPEVDAAASGVTAESSDGGAQAGRSGKKKGKKGKQIDPSLLGFKLFSNSPTIKASWPVPCHLPDRRWYNIRSIRDAVVLGLILNAQRVFELGMYKMLKADEIHTRLSRITLG